MNAPNAMNAMNAMNAVTQAPAQGVLSTVREVLAAHTTEPRLFTAPPDEVSLISLAIPSVEMIGILMELEDALGGVIDETRLYELQTLADLAGAFEDACATT
jgi:acyl carrier protein